MVNQHESFMCCRLTNTVYLMFLLAIYVGYALQSFPSADIICSYVQPFLSPKVPTWMRHFGRVGVLVALCLANCESLT